MTCSALLDCAQGLNLLVSELVLGVDVLSICVVALLVLVAWRRR